MSEKHFWKKRTALFLISQCITLFGSQIVQMAIVWHITLHTDSGMWVAAFSVCSYLPQFFVSFAGGVLADRCSRKWLIITSDAGIAAVTLLMILFMPHITEEPLLLFGLLLMSVIRSAGAGIQTPAVNAVIPQLVPKEHLLRWNGINAAMQSVVQFSAPAAAALLLTAGSLRSALTVDILTAISGIGLLTWIPLFHPIKEPEIPCIPATMRDGIRYTASHPGIRNLLIIYSLFVFFTVPAGYLSGLLVSRIYGDTY